MASMPSKANKNLCNITAILQPSLHNFETDYRRKSSADEKERSNLELELTVIGSLFTLKIYGQLTVVGKQLEVWHRQPQG